MTKYGLPMYGDCYHRVKEDGKPACGSKIEFWAVVDREPTDYRPCKRCFRNTEESNSKSK